MELAERHGVWTAKACPELVERVSPPWSADALVGSSLQPRASPRARHPERSGSLGPRSREPALSAVEGDLENPSLQRSYSSFFDSRVLVHSPCPEPVERSNGPSSARTGPPTSTSALEWTAKACPELVERDLFSSTPPESPSASSRAKRQPWAAKSRACPEPSRMGPGEPRRKTLFLILIIRVYSSIRRALSLSNGATSAHRAEAAQP